MSFARGYTKYYRLYLQCMKVTPVVSLKTYKKKAYQCETSVLIFQLQCTWCNNPNFCVSLSHRRSTAVSLETNPLICLVQ